MSRVGLSGIALGLGLFVSAQPGTGQAPSAPIDTKDMVSMRPAGPDDIIVTAPAKPTEQQAMRQARAISQVDGSVLYEPLARFHARLCPGIVGLPRDMAELMVDRIRFNAARIGIEIAKESRCQPNIVVAFARNGQAELQALARKQGYLFRYFPKAEIDKLLADSGPVHVWSNMVVRSRQGDEMIGTRDDLNDPPKVSVWNSHSHIFKATRRDIDWSVVMIDIKAIDGLSIDQIADYATMRSFARTRPASGSAAADTILSLFDPEGRHPQGLTTFDLAYLKSLYDSYDSVNATTVIAQTGRGVRKAPQSEPSASRAE